MPRTNKPAYEVSDSGVVQLDSRRQAIQDQYPLQVVKNTDGSIGTKVVGYVPNVDQSFGGLFKPTSPPPGRAQPLRARRSCRGRARSARCKNGIITNTVIK